MNSRAFVAFRQQMDAAEALSQLKAAKDLGQRLGTAAKTAGAQALASFDDGQSASKLLDLIDPKKEGKHPASVNGQAATKAEVREPGSAPVEAFASPLVVLDTPSAAVFATEAGIAFFAAGDADVVAQSDVHHTAAHTWSSVSGKTSSWYTHLGGIKAYAANGPVSLRAHTDALQIWADQEVTVISVNDEITISAQTRIELVAGQSSVTLEGSNIEFKTPGAFTAKGAMKAFMGGGGGPAELPKLPDGAAKVFSERFQLKDRTTGKVKANTRYWLTANGETTAGVTDGTGFTHIVYTDGPQAIQLEIEEDGIELRA